MPVEIAYFHAWEFIENLVKFTFIWELKLTNVNFNTVWPKNKKTGHPLKSSASAPCSNLNAFNSSIAQKCIERYTVCPEKGYSLYPLKSSAGAERSSLNVLNPKWVHSALLLPNKFQFAIHESRISKFTHLHRLKLR